MRVEVRGGARTGFVLLLLAVGARGDDLDHVRKLLASTQIRTRIDGVEALVKIDSRAAIDLLELTIRASNKEMERCSGAIDKLLDAQFRMLPEIRRVLRRLEAGVDATAEANELIRKLKAIDQAILKIQGDTGLHLRLVRVAGAALRRFRDPEAVRAIESGARTEPNPLLRQLYLGGLRDPSRVGSVPMLLESLDSKDPRIRAAAVRALIPLARQPGVAARVAQLNADENWAVRLGAMQAMTGAPWADAVSYLVEAALHETGEMARAADSYLFALTGASFPQDTQQWRLWWEARGASVRDGTWAPEPPQESAAGEVRTVASFFRIPIDSERILFALDFSGSMAEPLDLKDSGIQQVMARHQLEPTRLGYAQAEFIRAIGGLRDGVMFNVIGYNDDVKRFSMAMVKLDASSRSRAIRWVTRLETAELTNIFDALAATFQDYLASGPGAMRFKDLPDTVLLLTDGIATRGRFTEGEDLLTIAELWNKPLDIVFHCVGIGEGHDRALLERLATSTGGYYVDVTMGLKQIAPRRRSLPEGVTPPELPKPPTPEEIAAEHAETIDRLLDVLHAGTPGERVAALREIAALGPKAAAAAENVSYALQDPSPEVKAAAIESLVAIGPAAVPHLIETLRVNDVDCILGAALTLWRIGPKARAALPDLKKHSQHKDERIREAVEGACLAIQK